VAELYGGIEAGGTHFVCAVGSGSDDVRAETSFPTTTPDETIGRAAEFFTSTHSVQALSGDKIAAIGIASFGPVDLDPSSASYGWITSTPKPGWGNTDIVGKVREALDVPVGFDTDVNAAALSEHVWGSARGVDDFVYLTVGTGIGGGAVVNGHLVHGLVHPEMGHLRIPHDLEADDFAGVCPYHGDCLEGLASGPAIAERWGRPPEGLPEDHPAWELEATYLGLAVANLVCTLSPQLIIMGGGVMEQPRLLPLVRRKVLEVLNGYVQHPDLLRHIDSYIVPPGLGDRAGVLGAIALAQTAR
jgi:fructokinase